MNMLDVPTCSAANLSLADTCPSIWVAVHVEGGEDALRRCWCADAPRCTLWRLPPSSCSPPPPLFFRPQRRGLRSCVRCRSLPATLLLPRLGCAVLVLAGARGYRGLSGSAARPRFYMPFALGSDDSPRAADARAVASGRESSMCVHLIDGQHLLTVARRDLAGPRRAGPGS